MFHIERTCIDVYIFTCMPIAWIRCKLQRISCLRHRQRGRQLRCQAYASAFIPSAVGLRLPYLLFLIVPVLSLSYLGRLLESVPAAVKDDLLRWSREFRFTVAWRRASSRSPAAWLKTNCQVAPPYADISIYNFIEQPSFVCKLLMQRVCNGRETRPYITGRHMGSVIRE